MKYLSVKVYLKTDFENVYFFMDKSENLPSKKSEILFFIKKDLFVKILYFSFNK